MNIRQFFGGSVSSKEVKIPVVKPAVDLNTKVDPFEENVKEFVHVMTRENVNLDISSITSSDSTELFGKYREWGGKIDNECLFVNYIDRYMDELNETETGVNGIQRTEYAPVEHTFNFVILKKHFGMRSRRNSNLKTPSKPSTVATANITLDHAESESHCKLDNCACPIDGCNFNGSNGYLPFHYGKEHLQHLIGKYPDGTMSCILCNYETDKSKSMYGHIAKCSSESPYYANKKASKSTSVATPSIKRSTTTPSVKRSALSVKRNDMIRKTQIAEMESYAEAKYNSEMEQLQNQKMQIETRMEEIRMSFETTMASMNGISAIEASRMYSEMLQEEYASIVL